MKVVLFLGLIRVHVKLVLHKQVWVNSVITSLTDTLQTKAVLLIANSGFQ